MKELVLVLSIFVALTIWITGIVIAQGFWSTLFSIIIPPYAWYLAVEKFLYFYGVLTPIAPAVGTN